MFTYPFLKAGHYRGETAYVAATKRILITGFFFWGAIIQLILGSAKPVTAAPSTPIVRNGLPLQSERCAILWALTGIAQAGCHAPTLSGQPLRSLGPGFEGAEGLPGLDGDGYFVHFDFGSSSLPTLMKTHLDILASLLNQELGGLCVKLVGHTDTVGKATYNQSLSQERARSVRLYLAGPGGIAPQRLRSEGMGEDAPLPGLPGTASQNRRVEIMARPMQAGYCS